jgi:5-oxoprolinase (ATP-hydrolysing) subunit A
MKVIDLNADLGEGIAWESELLPLISSANICCAAHAGSPEITRATVEACLALNIRIGAHPGYPDPTNFGRKSLETLSIDSHELVVNLVRQVKLIPEAVYLKPHGALYNDSTSQNGGRTNSKDEPDKNIYDPLPVEKYRPPTSEENFEIVKGFVDYLDSTEGSETNNSSHSACHILTAILVKFRLPLMGLPFSYHEELAWFTHAPMIREGFIDRRYGPDNRLVPRSNPDALIHDHQEAIDQALRLATTCDSLCVHGDNPNAPELLAKVRKALEADGYIIAPK